jgi:hypothetical protein
MATGENNQQSWLDQLGQRRTEVAVTLLVKGMVWIVVALILKYREVPNYEVPAFGLGFAALASFATGLWFLLDTNSNLSGREAARILVLLLGGLIGIDLFLVTIGYVYVWRETVFAGWDEWQGKEGGRILILALLATSGPLLTFLSLLATRTEDHSQPFYRRLFYGFNTVLTGQLVLLILLLLNVLGYAFLPRDSDWTNSKIYTLDKDSRKLLKELERPIKVIAIVDNQNQARDILQLFNNSRAVTDKIQWELVLRGRQEARVRELTSRYTLLDPVGVLVVAGTEPNEDSQFIRFNDLYQRIEDPSGMRRRGRQPDEWMFKGEDALMTAIDYLEQGKNKAVVYFLQGHGELDISHSVEAARPTQKATQLRSFLEKVNYVVKPLRLSSLGSDKSADSETVVAKQVPEDAAAVVVAGPREPFEREALDALRQYMNPKEPDKKKGKLVVMLDVLVDPDKRMRQTGMERFVADFNVDVGNDRVLRATGGGRPDWVVAIPDPQPRSRDSLAFGLGEDLELRLSEVRTVKPRQGDPARPGGGAFQPDVLLRTTGSIFWAETNLDDPLKVIEDYNKIRKTPPLVPSVPIAATVSEASFESPPGMPHPEMFGGGSKPRMVVFGNARFASDSPFPQVRGEAANSEYYSLVASSLAWLREKPASIGIAGKKRDTYQMNPTTNVLGMVTLPALLVMVCVVGLGLGVWVVRRR